MPSVVAYLLTAAVIAALSSADGHSARNCRPCDVRRCGSVSAYQCSGGGVLKDRCGCCPVCAPTPQTDYPITENSTRHVDNCDEIHCKGFQMCIPNMQGLAVCRCPRLIFCRNKLLDFKKSKKALRVCGNNKIIYKSKCHMQVDICERAVPIFQVKFSICMSIKKKQKIERRRKRRTYRKLIQKRRREIRRKKQRQHRKAVKKEKKWRTRAMKRRARQQKLKTLAKLRNLGFKKTRRVGLDSKQRQRRKNRRMRRMKRRKLSRQHKLRD